MIDGENSKKVLHEKCFWCFYRVLSDFMLFIGQNLFFCKLRCFVAKSVLSPFTRSCVEKNEATNFTCGEKMTNMRYVAEFK